MGDLNVREAVDTDSIKKFTHALLEDIRALEVLINRGMIESDITRVGAEQELCMLDQYWRPAPIVMDVLAELNDPLFTTELARFNIEFNMDPLIFTGDCLSQMEKDLKRLLKKVEKVVCKFNADIILCGIVPSIRTIDIEIDNMTPMQRYQALFSSLQRMRGGPFEYHIQGTDELVFKQDFPSFEFCNTSFQIHYQVKPDDFIDAYNFSKLITAPVLAAATNSPLLFGKRLWKETRIALFQQAIDTRNLSHHLRRGRGRVSFSDQWIRDSIMEIFQDDVSRFRLLLYTDKYEDSLKMLNAGKIPDLTALKVFNGTIYRWNRACYGIFEGVPHLRIENRVLPAGPTVVDEVANAAFWFGLMHGLPDEYRNLPDKIEFDHAVDNFVNAARNGLDTGFCWLGNKRIPARELILKELLPIAHEGLKKANINPKDRSRFLDIIEARVRLQKTGSRWILDSFNSLKEQGYGDETLVAITAGIVSRQKRGKPVHEWSLAKIEEAGSWINKFGRVEQMMSTDLFTVQKDDLIDLVINIMKWKKIHHIPVEGKQGELLGLITSGRIIKYYASDCLEKENMKSAGDIMITDPVTVTPEMSTIAAVSMMQKHRVDCMPVVKSGRLIGIVTEHDFLKISARLLEEIFGKVAQ